MKKWILLAAIAWSFTGCEYGLPGGQTVFNTVDGDIPYPNNILFAGSQDGTININADLTDPAKSLKDMIDTLDGFSTSSAISVSLDSDMDSASLKKGLHLYKVDAQTSETSFGIPSVNSITKELIFGSDYIATIKDKKIIVSPNIPLESNSNYMMVLTHDIQNDSGLSLYPDEITKMLNSTHALVDENAQPTKYYHENTDLYSGSAHELEGLRLLTQKMFEAMMQNGDDCSLKNEGVSCDNVVMAWSFKTQTIGKVASAFIENNVSNVSLEVNSTGISTFFDKGLIYKGSLKNTPYYLGLLSEQNPFGPLTESFTFLDSDLPVQRARLDLPILMTVPKLTQDQVEPKEGWPLVIFQHGIGGNRLNLLAIADAFASVGYASIAMDLPLHGVDSKEGVLGFYYVPNAERTFDMDFMNNLTGAPGPDGLIDYSGSHYQNLSSLVTTRDNIRQSTSDFLALYNALSSAKGVKINTNKVSLVGHSLGGIAPFGFLKHKQFESLVLSVPGANITQTLNHSATKGLVLRQGLQFLAGIEPDSPEYHAFLLSAQTILDDADPINYAQDISPSQKMFILEIVGDANANLPDQTTPNNAYPTDPLAGTDPLIRIMGVSNLKPSVLDSNNMYHAGDRTVSRFNVGLHDSLLTYDLVTQEMQTQVASFIASKGTFIQVINPSYLEE